MTKELFVTEDTAHLPTHAGNKKTREITKSKFSPNSITCSESSRKMVVLAMVFHVDLCSTCTTSLWLRERGWENEDGSHGGGQGGDLKAPGSAFPVFVFVSFLIFFIFPLFPSSMFFFQFCFCMLIFHVFSAGHWRESSMTPLGPRQAQQQQELEQQLHQ